MEAIIKLSIKDFIKNNEMLSIVAYRYRTLFFNMSMKRYKKLPVVPERVLFNSFNGKGYCDNPKAIAEKMHELFPEYELVWACKDINAESSVPPYVKKVRYPSSEYFRIMSTAGTWVFNCLVPDGTVKKKDQCYIQTWHGDRALKKILLDTEKDMEKYKKRHSIIDANSELSDYFISGCEWFVPVWKRAAKFRGKFITKGAPRNDCLININTKKAEQCIELVKTKLNIPQNTKILLYAPTYRDHQIVEDVVASDIDLERIIDLLQKKDKCSWICLLRAHSGRKLRLNKQETSSEFHIIDVTLYPDMAELLMAADMLITDYSSCAGDYALLERPILIYQDDRDSYTRNDRTLYFEMSKTPFWTATSMEEAERIIEQMTDDTIGENCQQISAFYGSCETGDASGEVCRVIAKNGGGYNGD